MLQVGKKRSRRDLLDGWVFEGETKPGLIEILSQPKTLQVILRNIIILC
jgi:hypothetical protein